MAQHTDSRPSSVTVAGAARGLLGLLLLLTPLVFTRATLELFEYPKVALLRLTALGLAGLGLLAIAGRRWGNRTHSIAAYCREPVTLAVLLLTASAVLSTVTSPSLRTSLDGAHESFAGLATVAAYAAVFLATRAACRDAGDGWRLLTGVAVAAAAAACYALVQGARLDPLHWANESAAGGFIRPASTLGHANHLAAYLAMALPVVVAGAVRAAGNGRYAFAVAFAAVGVLALTGVAVTLSRTGWLAAGMVLPVTCAGLWFCGRRRAAGAVAGTLALVGVVGVATLFMAGTDLWAAAAQRLRNMSDGAGRPVLWQAAWGMACDRPLTGVGLDAFPLAFGRHRPAAFWQLEWNVTPTKAHNELMHLLATQGFPGALAALVLIATLANALRRAWRRADDSRLLTLAAGGAVIAFLVAGMFSFTVAATGTLFAVCSGILARLGEKPVLPPQRNSCPGKVPPGRWNLGLGLTVAGFVGVVAWCGVVQPLRADRSAASAVRIRVADPATALVLLEDAVARDPGRATLWAELAETARLVMHDAADMKVRELAARVVREATARTVQLEPTSPVRHARRGELLLELAGNGQADPTTPLPCLEVALGLDPRNPCILAGAARAAWACGRNGLAHEYLRRALALDPNQAELYATLGSFAAAEGRYEEAEARLAESFRRDWHGYEDAHIQAATLWGYCLMQLKRSDGAEKILRYAVLRRPDWPGPHLALAQLLVSQGQMADAAGEYRRVVELAPDHPFATEARKWLTANGR